MSLQDITTEMRNRVEAKGGLKGKTVKFDFGGDGVVRIVGTSEPATVDNENGPADCTIAISMADFIDMSQGKLNPTAAFMGGKLKVQGDMGIAMQLGSILN